MLEVCPPPSPWTQPSPGIFGDSRGFLGISLNLCSASRPLVPFGAFASCGIFAPEPLLTCSACLPGAGAVLIRYALHPRVSRKHFARLGSSCCWLTESTLIRTKVWQRGCGWLAGARVRAWRKQAEKLSKMQRTHRDHRCPGHSLL